MSSPFPGPSPASSLSNSSLLTTVSIGGGGFLSSSPSSASLPLSMASTPVVPVVDVTLKISVVGQGPAVKMLKLRCSRDIPIADLWVKVRQQAEEHVATANSPSTPPSAAAGAAAGGAAAPPSASPVATEYGLYFPKVERWLAPPQPQNADVPLWLLLSQGVKDKDEEVSLEFKKRHRPLRLINKVSAIEGQTQNIPKTVLVDDALAVGPVAFSLCFRLGIPNAYEFGLCLMPLQNTSSIAGTLSSSPISSVPSSPRHAPSASTHLASPSSAGLSTLPHFSYTANFQSLYPTINWLDQEKTLREQKISENEVITLTRKFVFSDNGADYNNPLHLYFLCDKVKR